MMTLVDRNIITYQTNEDSKKAFMDDLEFHRAKIEEAFNKYGAKLCSYTNADIDVVRQAIHLHDLSKCNNQIEYYGFLTKFYPSKEDGLSKHQRRFAYEKALLSHYHSNKDHPEFWVYFEDNKMKAIEMEPESVTEMILDWIATAKKDSMLSVKDYWVANRVQRLIHDNTVKLIDDIIDKVEE